jgi:S1-C subfamily serine protease
MARVTLYSSSRRSRTAIPPPEVQPPKPPSSGAAPPSDSAPAIRSYWPRLPWRGLHSPRKYLWVVAGAAFAVLLVYLHAALVPTPRELTQDDIDAAVLRTLQTKPLPSQAAKAYEVIRPSVVRVRGARHASAESAEMSVGSGVIIIENGSILTNLHVIAGAERVQVTFADGLQSEADVIGTRPEHDLAVIRARDVPDDIVPATLRSTQGLALGTEVVAVGFPFGIGPSVTAGVVSGLRREYLSLEGKTLLTNLIQFDAAVNPGSSGGPLVTAEGEVVGIVTSLLNPTERSFFVGIGFAVPIENAAAAVGVPPF